MVELSVDGRPITANSNFLFPKSFERFEYILFHVLPHERIINSAKFYRNGEEGIDLVGAVSSFGLIPLLDRS